MQPNLFIITICNQVETQLGFKIKNIADAHKASAQMAALKLHISPHTIARLYGVVKPFRTPYKDTLNVLARYCNFTDWEDFCENQTNIPFDPNFFLTEASDGFSLAILQLALVNEDFEALQLVLEKAKGIENGTIRFTAAELIGAYVRQSKKQRELLQLLAANTMGHLFFYECYVDEDNEENYFAEALSQYYLPQCNNDYRKLFVYCFIISQTAHKEQKASPLIADFLSLIQQLDKKNCHFHERSRWIECLMLIDGIKGVLPKTVHSYLIEIVELTATMPDNEKAWLLARPIKALVLFGLKSELFRNEELNRVVDDLIRKQKKEDHSIALYILQYYWICKSIYFNSKTIYSPFRIHNILFQNESNEKNAIEFAIASLFATGNNQAICNDNVEKYCEAKGIMWVLKLLEDS